MAVAADLLVRIEASTALLRSQLADADRAVTNTATKIETSLAKSDRAFAKTTQQGRVNMASLEAQLADIGTQLSTGTSPFIILAQQGPQVVDALGGVGNAFKLLGGIIRAHPIFTIATAIAATAGAIAFLTRDTDKAKVSNEDYAKALETVTELLETAEERSRRIAVQKRDEAKATLENAVAQETENAARLQNLLTAEKQIADANRRAGGAGGQQFQEEFLQSPVDELTKRLEASRSRIEEAQKKLAELANPRAESALGKALAGKDEKAGRETRERVSALDQLLEKMRDEVAILGVQGPLREEQKALIEAQNAAMRDGTLLTQDQVEEVKKLVEQRQNLVALDEQRKLTLQQETEEAKRIQKELNAEFEKTDDAAKELGLTFNSAFEDAIAGGKSFRDILKGIEADIARLIIRKAVTEPALDALKGANLGGLFSKVFGGLFAEGGRPPLGKVSIVGERGPELFVPDVAGRIVANDEIGFGGSSGPVFNIDARGASVEAVARLERMVSALNASVETRAVNAAQDAMRRNVIRR